MWVKIWKWYYIVKHLFLFLFMWKRKCYLANVLERFIKDKITVCFIDITMKTNHLLCFYDLHHMMFFIISAHYFNPETLLWSSPASPTYNLCFKTKQKQSTMHFICLINKLCHFTNCYTRRLLIQNEYYKKCLSFYLNQIGTMAVCEHMIVAF